MRIRRQVAEDQLEELLEVLERLVHERMAMDRDIAGLQQRVAELTERK